MGLTVKELLSGKVENHMLPFFWQHGEDEQTLRKYMRVIRDANCGAVCVESRPHPDFCGEKWWADLDVILDEARKLDMKVWILDDSHFPTGFANGAVKKAPDALKRRSVYCHTVRLKPGQVRYSFNFGKLVKKIPSTPMGYLMTVLVGDRKETYTDDRIISISARIPGSIFPVETQWQLRDKKLEVQLPAGAEKLYVTFTTRNAGIHRSYINMMDAESCRIQIDAVYEPHYAHYKEYFGNTIAGFFSDEPELGNAVYFKNDVTVGSDFDYPWSRELETALISRWGNDWGAYLPLLWDNDADENVRSRIRYEYMDTVTRLVERCFSKQIGQWCEERGVQYIGHMIEDGNNHARLGASLGHYFRGLSGQHMAGIDDIGGQVLPQKEDAPAEGINKLLGGRDGEFFHYLLGNLAASAAAIDPIKQGNSMCEIFGNYGWSEGPRLEKYLADHFMVQGINYYVPHAFSAKEYPDSDCPPHFYAHGHNPQYRHFGKLMAYMNRICALITGGKPVVNTAVLYHGDCEWAGEAMLSQKVTRLLMENQIGCHVIPADVFDERERYKTEFVDGFYVNGNRYDVLIIPAADNIPKPLLEALPELEAAGCKVIFADKLPNHVSGGTVLPLKEVLTAVYRDMEITPVNRRIRAFHYRGGEEIYYLVNEDDKPYQGKLTISGVRDIYEYDAWENKVYAPNYFSNSYQTEIQVCLRPGESMIIVAGSCNPIDRKACPAGRRTALKGMWKRSVCSAVDYPNFSNSKSVSKLEDYGIEAKHFSGFIAYETEFAKPAAERIILEITDAGEDVEVFVNGESAGIQVLPPFWFDITNLLQEGKNTLRIEVATTLERERKVNKRKWAAIGILGDVNLYLD